MRNTELEMEEAFFDMLERLGRKSEQYDIWLEYMGLGSWVIVVEDIEDSRRRIILRNVKEARQFDHI